MKPAPASNQKIGPRDVTLRGSDLEALVGFRPVPGVRRLRGRAPCGEAKKIYEAEGLMLGVVGRSLNGAGITRCETDYGTLAVYTRRHETVMESPASAACPVRLQAYWQIAASGTLDLHVLMASEGPVAGAEVHLETLLAAEQVLVPISHNRRSTFIDARRQVLGESPEVIFSRRRGTAVSVSNLVQQAPPPDMPAVTSSIRPVDLGATLLVYRLARGDCSYVEMVHSEDVRQLRIAWGDSARESTACCEPREKTLRAQFRLFGSELEKGVILRSRMRAFLVPREGDLQQAAELYERFLAEPPPLAV